MEINHSRELAADIGSSRDSLLSPEVGGSYEMICLPVKVHGSDGARARTILRPVGELGPGQTVSAEVAQ